MKLYYAKGTCSLAVHIALREADLPHALVKYDKESAHLEGGGALTEVNGKNYVPVLELDDGSRLTEVAVILQYVADRVPGKRLAPPAGTMERYRLQEWLNFIGMEIHKIYWPLFHDGAEVENEKARAKLGRSFAWTEARLRDQAHVLGEAFSVADAYLFTTLNWARAGGIDLAAWPRLADYRKQVRDRPGVRAALEAEGLTLKKPA